MTDDEFEARVGRFEQARRLGALAEIADHLGGPADIHAADRARLLVEFLCIDLEYSWREGRSREPARLEGYVERFAELGSLDQLPIELIGEEYRARRRWGDRPTHENFLVRFHDRLERIRAELQAVDAELEREFPSHHDTSRTRGRGLLVPEHGGADPLLSPDAFVLRRLIGAGGMGKVYEATRKDDSGRKVAVKFLRKRFLSHPPVVGRFLDEARTIAQLRHPQIVATEGLGRTIGGSYFIVMELVNGPDLARVVAGRTIAIEEAVRWVIAACHALEYAHERGKVHCDLKPANLLLDADGQVRVADFGFARSLDGDNPWALELEGTAPFMAPEQASDAWGSIDHRTDVYGIGAVLFALLTGRPPWMGRRVTDTLTQVIAATPVVSPADLRPDVPTSIVDYCRRCLAKKKADRFPTIREARFALESIRVEDD